MNSEELEQLSRSIQLAATCAKEGKVDAANAQYEQLKASAGQDSALNIQMGQLATALARHAEAAEHFSIALDAEPNNIEIICELAFSGLRLGRVFDAKRLFEGVLDIVPDYQLALYGMGVVNLELEDFEQAKLCLQAATREKVSEPKIFINLAIACMGLNDYDQARQWAEKALAMDSTSEAAKYTLGRIHTESGQREAATGIFERIIDEHEPAGIAFENLTRLKIFSRDDRAFIQRAEQALQVGAPTRDRVSLHFALGKMYDDCGEFEQAFQHYQQGNLLQETSYDPAADRAWFEHLSQTFTEEKIATLAGYGHESQVPVFVVGMPRTGTTLLERIVASHSQASGAGELQTMAQIARHGLSDAPVYLLRDFASGLEPESLQRYAEYYLDTLQRDQANTERIVDKLPLNYQHIGLIVSLFPNAKIIHAIRHPLDTCLSCYFQVFGHLPWASDLQSIATVYRLYREYMAHWARVLPENRILDVHYEDLIENPEQQARRIIDHIGLEWEPGILDFHKQDAVVKTVSLWQVRQPVYDSSKLRWKNYSNHLEELIDSLSDFFPEEGN